MNTTTKAAGIAAATLAGYDTLVRPRYSIGVPGGLWLCRAALYCA